MGYHLLSLKQRSKLQHSLEFSEPSAGPETHSVLLMTVYSPLVKWKFSE